MSADESVLVWAEENRCKVRRYEVETQILCSPWFHARYATVPDNFGFWGDKGQMQSFVIGVPVPLMADEPPDADRLEAAKDEFAEMFPQCKWWGKRPVKDQPLTILEFQCGNVWADDAIDMLEVARRSAGYAIPFVDARRILDPLEKYRERR